jgi:hypothetical protein
MSMDDMDHRATQLGQLSIEHFSNPSKNSVTDLAIAKILQETSSSELPRLIRNANSHAGKVGIAPQYDRCGNIERVDFNFHPLFSLFATGKDLSIDLSGKACNDSKRK